MVGRQPLGGLGVESLTRIPTPCSCIWLSRYLHLVSSCQEISGISGDCFKARDADCGQMRSFFFSALCKRAMKQNLGIFFKADVDI